MNTMTLVRWQPFRGPASLHREVVRFFDDFWGTNTAFAPTFAARWAPPLDVSETDRDLVLSLDIPGVRAEDVAIEVNDRVLTIRGERSHETSDEVEHVRRVERRLGSFSRQVRLPQGIDPEAITAEHADGVLVVRVPKPEAAKPTTIAIGKPAAKTIDAGEPDSEASAA